MPIVRESAMDALSDVLQAVRLTGAVFFDIRACEPFAVETPEGRTIVGTLFPGAEHLIPYHIVMQGACWAGVIGEAPVHLSTGDIVMFPQGDAHVMSSVPGLRKPPDLAAYRRPEEGQLPFAVSTARDQGEPTRLLCGYLTCDARPFNPLLAALPNVIRIGRTEAGAVGALAAFAVAESKEARMGGESVLARLSELMFVDVVRRYVETLPPERRSWLAGLRDPFVGRALTALHRSPARDWTLDALAREVGLSRSALAERFTGFVGQPAMQYLANWRMQLAANHLLSGVDNVAEVAARVGYESEAAFSRAFKKTVGMPPSDWRHRNGQRTHFSRQRHDGVQRRGRRRRK